MDDIDRVLDALRVQIKKEIVDNYFGDRVYLEEDTELLEEEMAAYRQDAELAGRGFLALYQALGTDAAIAQVLDLLQLPDRPYYQEFQELAPGLRPGLLRLYRSRGLTRTRRYLNLAGDVYEKLQQTTAKLKEQYDNILIHVRLLNEDIDKFNLSYDFGLIAAQIEAMEGRQECISGALICGEREELSTRMRFKRRKLTPEVLPELPVLPRLKEIWPRLKEVLKRNAPA